MIEIFTSGFFVGKPHEVGGGGAVIKSETGEIGRVKKAFRSSELSSSLAVEIMILAEALEKVLASEGRGERVVVRTGYSSLADLCKGRGLKGTPELKEVVDRLSEMAKDFAEIQAVVSPGWVTARPHDLAVRAVLDQYRDVSGSLAAPKQESSSKQTEIADMEGLRT